MKHNTLLASLLLALAASGCVVAADDAELPDDTAPIDEPTDDTGPVEDPPEEEVDPEWVHTTPEDPGSGGAATDSKYAAVFRARTAAARTITDASWSSFTGTWSTLSGQGFRLIDIDTSVRDGARVYSGVMEPGTGGHYLWNAAWDSFVAKWNELSAAGYRLVDLETYVEGGQRLWIGVWRPGNDAHYLWAGADWNGFVTRWQENAAAGLRLTNLEIYEEGGQLRYAGVFRAGGDAYGLWVGVDWNAFSKKWMEWSAAGMRLVDMEAYTFGGARLYAGVYRAGAGAYDLVGATNVATLQREIARLAAEGKQPVQLEIETGADQPPPGFAAVLHDEVDARAVGYSFAVARDGKIVSAGGNGYARAPWEASEPGVAMTGNKRSHVASISKPITAVAIMNLLEDNPQLTLDSEVMDLIGHRFTTIGQGVGAVTLRDLLQHRSGMQPWGYCGPDLQASMRDLVDDALVGTRGVTQRYSNGNYCLLRMVIDELGGTDYVRYVQDRVLAPMGITGASCKPDTIRPTLYYQADQTAGPGFLWTDDYAGHCSAYGWYLHAADLARFLAGVRADTVLSAATTSTMMAQQLGWWTADTALGNGTSHNHNGGWITGDGRGFNGAIMRLDDGSDLVVLINSNGFDATGILLDATDRMAAY